MILIKPSLRTRQSILDQSIAALLAIDVFQQRADAADGSWNVDAACN